MLVPTPMSPNPIQVRYETLLEVAQSIVAHRQLSTLFTDLSRCLKSLVTFDFIVLTLLDPKSQTVRLHILETDRAVVGEAQHEVAGEETPTALSLRERRPYYAPDAQALGRFPRVQQLIQANGCESFCTLPLFTAQGDLGGLTFGSTQKNAYSPEDIEFMEHVARQVAIAVENALNAEAARAYEGQLAQERDRLRALLEVNNAAVSCLSMRSLFQTVASALRRIFGLDFASIMTYDGEKDVLRLKVLDFPDSQGAMQEDAEIPVANTLAGIIFRGREGRVLETEDIRRMSPVTNTIMEREGLRSICATPMIFLGETLGMLSVGSRQAGFFNPEDIPFYTQVAGQIAIALQNALSFKRIEELNAHLAEEKVYLEDEIRTDNRFEDIIGQSRALKAILKQVADAKSAVAQSNDKPSGSVALGIPQSVSGALALPLLTAVRASYPEITLLLTEELTGNLISGGGWPYTYDDENRLIGMVSATDTQACKMVDKEILWAPTGTAVSSRNCSNSGHSPET